MSDLEFTETKREALLASADAHESIPDAAVDAAANQLRSQFNDFTSPDVLMRKRARMTLRAAIPYLGNQADQHEAPATTGAFPCTEET